ncbi:hypothetical protein D3C72_2300520 [compost metagenome]
MIATHSWSQIQVGDRIGNEGRKTFIPTFPWHTYHPIFRPDIREDAGHLVDPFVERTIVIEPLLGKGSVKARDQADSFKAKPPVFSQFLL